MADPFDSNYEFNAPKFVDFLNEDHNEDADTWFGKDLVVLISGSICFWLC